nr:uncharacterized protein LOC113826620 [Penaeus vannamei]
MIGKNLTSPEGYLSVVSEEPPTEESSPTPSDSSPPDPPPRPTLLAVPSKVEVEVGHRAVLECITDDVISNLVSTGRELTGGPSARRAWRGGSGIARLPAGARAGRRRLQLLPSSARCCTTPGDAEDENSLNMVLDVNFRGSDAALPAFPYWPIRGSWRAETALQSPHSPT